MRQSLKELEARLNKIVSDNEILIAEDVEAKHLVGTFVKEVTEKTISDLKKANVDFFLFTTKHAIFKR